MSPPGRFRRAALLLLLVFAASGCPSRRSAAGDAMPPEPILLVIHNNHWSDVTIFVLAAGQTTRIGSVTATQSAEFRFPDRMITDRGSIRLVARALAGPRPHTSEPIVLRPGLVVEWRLETQLRRSSLMLY